MTVSTVEQAKVFLLSIFSGTVCGFLYDLFRLIRKSKKTKDKTVFLQDLSFWVICAISVIFFGVKYVEQLRYFQIIGAFSGALIYAISAKNYVLLFLMTGMEYIKKVLKTLFRIVLIPIVVLYGIFSPYVKKIINFIDKNNKKSADIIKQTIAVKKKNQKKIKKRIKML